LHDFSSPTDDSSFCFPQMIPEWVFLKHQLSAFCSLMSTLWISIVMWPDNNFYSLPSNLLYSQSQPSESNNLSFPTQLNIIKYFPYDFVLSQSYIPRPNSYLASPRGKHFHCQLHLFILVFASKELGLWKLVPEYPGKQVIKWSFKS
jgi:hypothetical protein